jgi:hypothetical protein
VGQSDFHLFNGKKKVVIPFKLINNLVFIPIKVNGEELTFLLDTGVEETVLFSLDDKEEIKFFQVEKIKLKGLGSKEAIDAYKSSKNILDAKGYVDASHELYLVLDQEFNFSSQVGIPVNGIIGYHFFKNHKVEINYDRRKVIVYEGSNPKIDQKLQRQFEENSMPIEEHKPYYYSTVSLNYKSLNSKLLLDTGNSDALWLFLHASKDYTKPAQTVHDFLGRGFSGDIYGLRGRVQQFDFGHQTFLNPISTFPDSVSVQRVNFVPNRVGSIGGEVLSRFDLVFDYPNQRLYSKPNRKVKDPFNYNMSGLEVQHAGLEWSNELVDSNTSGIKIFSNPNDERLQKGFQIRFVLKPVFTIFNVREGSTAQLAGLKKGDRILSLNGRNANEFTIERINELLKSGEGKPIDMEVERHGTVLAFRFLLKSIL